ncbi:MAG: hypothetical protein EXS32_03110 [Opitutus sp.]|nr:hypothetical protein [Opitutus sp.]
MKRILFTLILVGGAAFGSFAADLPATKPTLATLAWLTGSWTCEKNGRVVTEHWLAPAGGTMLQVGRTVAKGKTVEYEFVVLHEEGNGDILYTAKPSGQPEATFKLVRGTATEAAFENLEHDFPQRVLYTLKPDGTLLAAIEGTKNGQMRRVEFPYRRAAP